MTSAGRVGKGDGYRAGVSISSCVENAEDRTGIRGRRGQFVGSQRQE
jgi:hypothetical protein